MIDHNVFFQEGGKITQKAFKITFCYYYETFHSDVLIFVNTALSTCINIILKRNRIDVESDPIFKINNIHPQVN